MTTKVRSQELKGELDVDLEIEGASGVDPEIEGVCKPSCL